MKPNVPMAAELQAVFDKYGYLRQQELEMHDSGGGAKPPNTPLNNGGDGGKSPNMEPRVAKLEAHMDHVRGDLAKLVGLPETTGRIEERIKALPDKDWVGTKMRNWVGGVGSILGLLMIALKYIG
jgi:hypothetical protein